MLHHKLRRRASARLSGNGTESGFTLVELLVVMLILGVLAAIAIPAFFNQRSKANDAQAKASAHSAAVALETYATDNNGTYVGATPSALNVYEPTLTNASYTLTGLAAGAYVITVTAPVTTEKFIVTRTAGGGLAYSCTPVAKGGCPAGGNWGQ